LRRENRVPMAGTFRGWSAATRRRSCAVPTEWRARR
jgi:hypothetical protein